MNPMVLNKKKKNQTNQVGCDRLELKVRIEQGIQKLPNVSFIKPT